jgi:DNA repair protein RadC
MYIRQLSVLYQTVPDMSIYKQYELSLELADGSDDEDDLSVDPPSSAIHADQVREQHIIDEAFEILAARHRHGDALTTPEDTKRFLRLKLADMHNEVFGGIFLDNRHRVIAIEDMFFGTIDGASVHPRVVVEKALGHHAAALIVYHNHPSGVAEPSQADRRVTGRIKEALAIVDIRLLDHLVVSVEGCASFAERGILG